MQWGGPTQSSRVGTRVTLIWWVRRPHPRVMQPAGYDYPKGYGTPCLTCRIGLDRPRSPGTYRFVGSSDQVGFLRVSEANEQVSPE